MIGQLQWLLLYEILINQRTAKWCSTKNFSKKLLCCVRALRNCSAVLCFSKNLLSAFILKLCYCCLAVSNNLGSVKKYVIIAVKSQSYSLLPNLMVTFSIKIVFSCKKVTSYQNWSFCRIAIKVYEYNQRYTSILEIISAWSFGYG